MQYPDIDELKKQHAATVARIERTQRTNEWLLVVLYVLVGINIFLAAYRVTVALWPADKTAAAHVPDSRPLPPPAGE